MLGIPVKSIRRYVQDGLYEHDDNRIRPLDELLDIYLNTVGANANLILNVPTMPGRIFKKMT